MIGDSSERELAQEGLRKIEDAILALLEMRLDGLRNSEIAECLGLRSDFRGKQKDYLTYSVLGRLMKADRVTWNKHTKLFTRIR